MDKIKRIQELVSILKQASKAYYVDDNPIIPDVQYDNLYQELLNLEKETGYVLSDSPTKKIGYTVLSRLQKVSHEIPLLSLDKTKSIDEIKEFMDNKECQIGLKADGLTVELNYVDGEFISGSTRGDSVIGEDISHNIKTFKNIPLNIPFKGKLTLAGEAVILISDFEKLNENLSEEEKYSTPRNTAAGSVRQLDNKICSERNIRFYAFKLLKVEGLNFERKSEQIDWLEQLGFEIIPTQISNAESIEYDINQLKEVAKHMGLPIDGMVITYNNIKYSESLGKTAKFPKDSVAYKFEDERVETEFISVEWNTTRSGKVNPVGLFKPVEIDGTIVERATLFNLDIFEALQLGKGDKISTFKANMIIPQIDDNFTRSNTETIPKRCPACGSLAEIRTQKIARFLYCTNDNCIAKYIDQIVHFVSRKALNVEGLSEATIEKFIEKGFIKGHVDIFKLQQYRNEIVNMDGFGKRSYTKLIEAIEKAKDVELNKFIYSLGIEQIGEGGSKNLCQYFNNDIQRIMDASYSELLQVKDFGEVTVNSVYQYFRNDKNRNIVNELLEYVNIKRENKTMNNSNNNLSGKVFVITGTLSKPRDDFKKLIENHGGTVTGSVSKKTHYLLAGANVGASKTNKAKECGTQVISEDEFNQMIGE